MRACSVDVVRVVRMCVCTTEEAFQRTASRHPRRQTSGSHSAMNILFEASEGGGGDVNFA